jgi:hypothetical protein
VHAAVIGANLPAAEAIEVNKAMERIYDIRWEGPDVARGGDPADG